MRWVIWLMVCGLTIGAIGNANGAVGCRETVTAISAAKTVSIVELYTSEGCDSCPPADKWFSAPGREQQGVIRLAFHVDYWDYIGWKDRFAQAGFAERQRDIARRQGSRAVYTPQVMLDGGDFRPWSSASRYDSAVREVGSREPQATLSLRIRPAESAAVVDLVANFRDAHARADANIYFAVTENNLVSRVTAGENRGATLRHDHVVRALYGPIAADARDSSDGSIAFTRTIALPREWKRDDLSVAAFAQSRRTGEVLQGIDAVLCR